MVLRNCIVLLIAVSQVIATPHGYGVKGAGAAAKAEASASASAFAGLPPIPIPIPNGGGFSGSYSKSSSSSFASSSASASSSSSSFSFSGSDANAINGFGLNGGCSFGSCGCSTGSCQNNGANDIKISNNGNQGQDGSAAQSAAFNKNQGIDCSSGLCDTKPNLGCTTEDCTYNNKGIPSNDCKLGNCEQTNSPNDIYVNIPGRSTKNPEEPSEYDVTGTGQSLLSNGKPSTFEPECNSYDCISPSQNPKTDDKKRPSSYDVPIFGSTAPSYFPDKREPCTSTDCQSNDSSNNKPIKPGYNNNSPLPQSAQCAGGICTSQTPAPQKNNAFTSSYTVNTNQPTYNSPENCGPLGCGNGAQPHGNSKYPQSYESSGKSTTPGQNYYSSTGPSNFNTKQPTNTFKYPGDCGSLGCGLTLQEGTSNNKNQASAKGSVDNSLTSGDQSGCVGFGCSTPSIGNTAITKQPYFSSLGDCGASGCSPKTDTSYSPNQPNYQNYGNSFDSTKCHGSSCAKPTYTNYQTTNVPAANCGPSGCTPHTSADNVPSYNQPGYGGVVSPSTPGQASPSWSTQSTAPPSSGYTNSYSGTSYRPTSPVSSEPNREIAPPNQNSEGGVNTKPYDGVNPNDSTFYNKQNTPGYTSSYGSTSVNQDGTTSQYSQNGIKPFGSPNSGNNNQIYTGGFGAPKGPIDQGIPAKPQSTGSPSTQANISPSNIPSASPYKPTDSGSYNQNPIQSSSAPHITVPQPSVSNNNQVYTGGFGAPKGPIDQGIPAKPHDTSTGNPSTKPNASPYKPTNSGSYNQNPVNSSPVPHVTVPQPSISKDSNNNNQIYTGGFGAPKDPINQGIPAKPHVTSTGSPSIQAPTSSSNIPYASQYKPTNSGSYNQNPIQSSVAPHAHSSGTKYSKGALYTGGFGGPSGFLKPNDYSIPDKLPTPGTGPSNTAPCASNNCGSKSSLANSYSGATHDGVANANAQALASAVAYTGGFRGPPGFLKPFDDGKVPSNGNANGNPSFNLHGSNGNSGYSNINNKNTANGIYENGSGNSGAVAQANAVATSSAGGYGLGASSNGGVKGCSLGCDAHSGNGADGFNAHNHGIHAGAVASAKSVAGAGSYGAAGSFAGSSASAHASAGAATKGGYGRR